MRSGFLPAIFVALAVAGCGSTSLHATRTVAGTATPFAPVGTAPVILSFTAAGRAWAIGPRGALVLLGPQTASKREGSLPPQKTRSGARYIDAFGFAVDPVRPNTIYVDSDALYVSHDGGRTWRGTERDAGGNWAGQVTALAPVAYALRAPTSCSADGDCGPGVWRLFASADRGLTWRRVSEYDSNEIWALVPAAARGAVFVATATGLYLHRPGQPDVERDAGIQRSYGYQPSTVMLAASGPARSALYAATSSGDNDEVVQIYASSDQGRHWHLRRSPFAGRSGLLVGDPARPNIVYAVVNTPTYSSANAYASRSTVFRSSDSANSWREIWHGCQLVRSGAPQAAVRSERPAVILLETCSGAIVRIRA